MTDKKLTDNLSNDSPILPNGLTDAEIVKALEVWLKKICDSYQTSLDLGEVAISTDTEEYMCLLRGTLDLINRLQAENERLKEEKETLKSLLDSSQERYFEISNLCHKYRNKFKTAKAEAYKECIEKVKDTALVIKENAFQGCYVISKENLYNLLKELVGEKE